MEDVFDYRDRVRAEARDLDAFAREAIEKVFQEFPHFRPGQVADLLNRKAAAYAHHRRAELDLEHAIRGNVWDKG